METREALQAVARREKLDQPTINGYTGKATSKSAMSLTCSHPNESSCQRISPKRQDGS